MKSFSLGHNIYQCSYKGTNILFEWHAADIKGKATEMTTQNAEQMEYWTYDGSTLDLSITRYPYLERKVNNIR